MRPLTTLSLVVALSGFGWADAPPFVSMSGKVITPIAPSIIFTVKSSTREIPKTRVFTVSGKEVAELSALSSTRFVWDGKDRDQQDVDPGFYVVQIQQNGTFWHAPVIVKR